MMRVRSPLNRTSIALPRVAASDAFSIAGTTAASINFAEPHTNPPALPSPTHSSVVRILHDFPVPVAAAGASHSREHFVHSHGSRGPRP
jgi:hypothetical protein